MPDDEKLKNRISAIDGIHLAGSLLMIDESFVGGQESSYGIVLVGEKILL